MKVKKRRGEKSKAAVGTRHLKCDGRDKLSPEAA